MESRMKELITILNEASDAYYNQSKEIMSNKEYDALFDELRKLEEESGIVLDGSPTIIVGSMPVSDLEKKKHEYPALSLDKTKDPEALKKMLGDKAGVLSHKADGLTAVVTYRYDAKQKCSILESVVTRGNGHIGEVVTHNAKAVAYLPEKLFIQTDLVIRGEVVVPYYEYERVNREMEIAGKEKYKSIRGLASGGLRQLDPAKAKGKGLQFRPFFISFPEFTTMQESFEFLKASGFNPVEYAVVTAENVVKTVAEFELRLPDVEIPTDGLVLAFNDKKYGESLGMTGHHPKHSIAFKWKDDAYATTLKEIEWSASKTGLLNPVAIFEPIEMEDGTTVSRASVHNVSIVKELQLGIGDIINVYKANMIIPQIASNDTKSNTISIPEVCPVCGAKTVIKTSKDGIETLICPNPYCEAKTLGQWKHFVSRDCMNIEGLAESQLADLIKAGYIKKYSDLYILKDRNLEHLKAMPGWGENSISNLLSAIEKSRTVPLNQFIDALSIPLIGTDASKLLAKHFKYDPNEFYNFVMNGIYIDLDIISGFGETMIGKMIDWRNRKPELLSNDFEDLKLLIDMLQFEIPKIGDKLSGKTFVITGSLNHYTNRDALIVVIEKNGGKVSGSVSAKTSYLINNDITSTSGKNKKAQQLNVPIITEEDFEALLI